MTPSAPGDSSPTFIVGIDDTDTLDTRGTNQLAKAMVRAVADRFVCDRIVRHQLLEDPRVPFTSKNGSASLVFTARPGVDVKLSVFAETLQDLMLADFIPGSDPGLCVVTAVPEEIIAYGRRCQQELMTQPDAMALAERHGLWLRGLGGSCDGVIGALAAIGLSAYDDDGRVVQWREWPDDFTGWTDVAAVIERDVQVRRLDTHEPVHAGQVDVGKHLRPNWRQGRCTLLVLPAAPSDGVDGAAWTAVKAP